MRHTARQELLLEVAAALVGAALNKAAIVRVVFEKIRAYFEADICLGYRVVGAGGALILVDGIGGSQKFRDAAQALRTEPFRGPVAGLASIAHPLRAHGGRVIGWFVLASTRRHAFESEDAEFLEMLCHYIALSWQRLDAEDERRDEERRARDSEARLALALSAANAGAWDWDVRTGDISWSRENYHLFGRDPALGAPRYQDWMEALLPTDRAKAGALVNEVLAGRTPEFRAEFRVQHPERGARWILGVGRVTFSAAGEPERMSGINVDITERKRAEEASLEQAHRLRLTMEAASTGIWDWDLATDAVHWSAQCYAIHGLREDEFDGTAGGFGRLVHPQDREQVWHAVRGAIDRRETYESTFRIVRPGGEERLVTNRGRALYDDAGKPLRMIGTLVDITERRRAELELLQANTLISAVGENTSDLIFTKDLEGRMTYANPATLRVLGRPATAVIGRTSRDWCANAAEAAAIMANDRRVMTGGTETVEEVFTSAVGTRTFLSVKSPLRDVQGAVVGICGISRDITERRAMEDRLLAEDRSKREFMATISHELRSPLAPILMAVEVMRNRGVDTDPQLHDVFGIVDRQVGQIVRLIGDLLDASRVGNGKLRLQREAMMLDHVIGQAVETVSSQMEKAGQRLEVSLPLPQVRLDADPVRLVQIFANLLSNASRYGKPGGVVAVRAQQQADTVIVQVEDDGIGIPAGQLGRVFELFSQVDPAADRSQGGLGIGLSLTRGLVELHGGTIEAESDGPERGSRFTVRLPCLPAKASGIDLIDTGSAATSKAA